MPSSSGRPAPLIVPNLKLIRSDLNANWPINAKIVFEEMFRVLVGSTPGLRLLKKVIDRVGAFPEIVLGAGAMGVAFGLPDGKVLKLTRDQNELATAAYLTRAARSPHIVRFHDAFVARNGVGIGVIVRDGVPEVLGQLTKAENLVGVINSCIDVARDAYEAGLTRGESVEAIMVDASSSLRECLNNAIMDDYTLSDWDKKMLHQLVEGISHLHRLGIYGVDFHPGNLGLDKGQLVIFDIGLTTSPEIGEIDSERVEVPDEPPAALTMLKNPPLISEIRI